MIESMYLEQRSLPITSASERSRGKEDHGRYHDGQTQRFYHVAQSDCAQMGFRLVSLIEVHSTSAKGKKNEK